MGNIQVCSRRNEMYNCYNEDSEESDYYSYSNVDLQKSIQLEEQTLNKDLEYESNDEEYITFNKYVKKENIYMNQEKIESGSCEYKELKHNIDNDIDNDNDIYGNQSIVDSQKTDHSENIYSNQEIVDLQESEIYSNNEVENFLKKKCDSNLSLYDKVDWTLIRNHLATQEKSGNYGYSNKSQEAIKNYNNFIIAEARRIEKK